MLTANDYMKFIGRVGRRFSFVKFSMANFHFKTKVIQTVHVQQHNAFHHVQIAAEQMLKLERTARNHECV